MGALYYPIGEQSMVMMDIYRIFEQRKYKIEQILNNGHALEQDKRLELRGAANEIDIFLKTIEHYYTKVPHTPAPQFGSEPEKQNFFSRLFKKS